MFGQLKLKKNKKKFEKKKENTEIYCYQDLNSNTSLSTYYYDQFRWR